MQPSVMHVFFATADGLGDAVALRYKQDGSWRDISWGEYAARVRRLARGLISLGLEPGGTVVIVGHNRWEWLVADLAIMAAGGVPAPIYPTSTSGQLSYIAAHCGATLAVVEDVATARRLDDLRSELPELAQMVVMEGADPAVPAARDSHQRGGEAPQRAPALTLEALMARGDEAAAGVLATRLAGLTPQTLATLIYTSGTTGRPKGVMLSHKNLMFATKVTVQAFSAGGGESFISYLPLSHIAEQLMSIHLPLTIGGTVSIAESLEKLGENLREVRPTILFAVPRVWEKIEAGFTSAAAKAPPFKKRLVAWARAQAQAAGELALNKQSPRRRDLLIRGLVSRQTWQKVAGKTPPAWMGDRLPITAALAHRAVLGKVQRRLGLDRCRFPTSGAAALSDASQQFFLSLGVLIYATYGLSEVTGPAVANTAAAWTLGTAGRALPDTEVKLAEDNEILIRGDHVFEGYLKDPEATAEALVDGWLLTGDVGRLDPDGFLTIVDRKKDIIVTSAGKNIAPQAIEALLKAIPLVSQATVVGDGRKYVTALVALDPTVAPTHASGSDHSPAALALDRGVLARLEAEVARVNETLARFETIKRFHVLPRELSVEAGELTPTLKTKRAVVERRYRESIDTMYSGLTNGDGP